MTKPLSHFIVLASLTIIVVGCGGKDAVKVTEAPDCVFPDAISTPAPGWICDEPVANVKISAVGSADKSGAGHDFMKQMAATSARVLLAQRIRVHVQNSIKQFAETTGAATSETVDKVNSLVTKQITAETVAGTRILKSRTSPNGALYVLVGMDKDGLMQTTQNALSTSMNNDNALWQQFKAKNSQEELAADIAKMTK
ncbi:MAG: LPP20 family lipoprotein [Thiohalomonadales bacterium]